MKKNWKKILALVLAASVIFCDSSLVYAAQTIQVEETENIAYTETYINPLYEGVYTEADLVSDDAVFVMSAEDIECYTDIDNMAKDIREKMVNRESAISVRYEYQGAYSPEYITEVMNSAFDQAVKHTGNPVEGDYLKYQYVGWSGNIAPEVNGNTVSVTYTYMPTYFTTAEQEQQMNQTVNALLEELSLDNSTDYEKVTKIYDYICENITYDFTNLNDNSYKLKHSAYAALINKTAVCQGYAVLFYRLALEAGIDARVITGYGNGDHAWNIVELDNCYYNLDATWDAGITPYNYYLKNMDDFLNHMRSDEFSDASFIANYPMAAVSYDPDASVNQSPEYNGTIKNNDENKEILYIRAWEMENLGLTFSESAVLDILNKRIAAGESFTQVMIGYPDTRSIVGKDVWNAVKSLMDNTDCAGFCFSGNNLMDENWFVADMQTATKDVVLDAKLTLGEAGECGKVIFGNTAIPAGDIFVRFNTGHWNDGTPEGTGGRDDYGKFVATFGTASCGLDLIKNGIVVGDGLAAYEYYSENPGNDNLNLQIDDVGGLEANVEYTLTKKKYTGERDWWPDGTAVFRVERRGFENAGEPFTESAVLTILQNEAATGNLYDRVEIVYPSGWDTVNKDIWNAAAGMLSNIDNKTISITIERSNRVPLMEWEFEKPGNVTADVNCVAELTAGNPGEGGKFRYEETNASAMRIRVRFNTDTEDNYFTPYEDAFGNYDYEMDVKTSSGGILENASGYYDHVTEDWGSGINVTVRNLENLSTDTWYFLQKKIYTGSVEQTSDGPVLYVRAWEMEKLGIQFNDTNVLNILNKRIAAGESFAQVMISYPNNPGVVSKEVWNAVKALMNNTEWSAGFFFSGNNLMDENWFVADMQTATNDVVLNAALTLGEVGEYGKVTFGNTSIPARGAHIRFNTEHWTDGTPEGSGGRDDYGKFVAAFGTANCRLDLIKNGTVVDDTSVRYEYKSEGPGNDNLSVCVDHVNTLEANVEYTLTKKAYAGERDQWDDGTTIFRVERSGFENAGESFSETAVLSLLQKEAATDAKYDRVELTYPSGSTKVAKDVWNAAAALLTNSDSRTVSITIERSSTVPLQEWSFMRAKTVSTEVVCVADFVAGNSGEGISFRFNQTNVVGENISVRLNMDDEDSYFAPYEDALGYECYEMKVTDPDGVLMGNSGGYYDYMKESWGKGINLNVWNLENLSAGVWYHLDKKVYIGNVNSWTEDGKLYSSLEISPNSGNKLSFTDDEVVEILKNHSGKKYNVILIEQRLENHGISKKVANEAVKYLADPTEDRPGELRFGFWDNSESIYAQWIIRNPKQQDENHAISFEYVAEEGKNPTVQISNPKILADSVSVQLTVHRDHPLNYFNHTLAALGENPGPVILQGTQVRGWYEYDEYGLWINIDMISPLDSNETYVVCPWEGEETPVIDEIKVEILENGLPMNVISQPGKTDIYLMNSKNVASKKASYPLEAKVKYSPDEDYSDYLNEADLTWTTSDKKLAEVSVNPMTGEAVLNIKKGAVGTVEITVTANDEGNESYTFELMIVDTAVRVDSSKLNMNSYLEEEGILKVYPNVSYLEKVADLLGVNWDVTISVLEGDEVLEVDTGNYNKVTGELGVRFANEEEANKTFTLKLQVNQYVGEFETEEILTFKITNKKVKPKLTLKAVTPYNIAYMNEAAYAEVLINLSAPVAGTESDPAIYMDSDIFRLESLRKISDTQWSAKLSMKDEPELKVNQTKSFSMKAAVRYDGHRVENTASVKVSATNKAPSISVYGNEAYKTALYPQLSLEEAKVLIAVPAGFGETGMYADAVNGVLVLGKTTVSLPEKIAKSFEIVSGEFVSGAVSVDSKGNKVTVGDALLITVRSILGEKAKSGNIQFVVENNDVISSAVTTKALKVYVEKVTSLAMSMIAQHNGKKTTSATFQKSFAGKEVLTLIPSIPEQIVNIYKMNGMNPSEHLILKVEPADKNAVKVFENGTLSIEENSEGNVEIKTTEALFEEGVSSCKVKFTVYATNNGLESALKSVNFTVKLQKKDTMVSAKAAAKGNLNVVAADSKVTVTPTFANLPMGAQVVGVDFVNATDAAFYKINDVQNNSGVLTICKYAIDTVLPIAKNTVPLAYKIQMTDGTLHTVEAAVKINVTQTATVKADVKSVVLYNSVVGASYGKDVVFTETKSGAAIKNIEFTGLENSGISTKQIAGENGERIVTFYVDGEKDRGPKKSYTAKATVTLDGAGTKKGKEITYTTSVKVTLNN